MLDLTLTVFVRLESLLNLTDKVGGREYVGHSCVAFAAWLWKEFVWRGIERAHFVDVGGIAVDNTS